VGVECSVEPHETTVLRHLDNPGASGRKPRRPAGGQVTGGSFLAKGAGAQVPKVLLRLVDSM
jgi:hypothetical protein